MAHLPFEVYLLDEVMTVGDVQFQEKVRQKTMQFAATNKTVLLASHNFKELLGFDKYIVLERNSPSTLLLSDLEYQQYAERVSNLAQFMPVAERNFAITDFSKFPRSEFISMDSISLGQQESEPFNTSDPFELNIEFQKLQSAEIATVVYFSDFQGNVIFSTAPFIKNGFTESPETGRYTYSCKIPAYIFGPHTYRVTVMFILNPKEAFRSPSVLVGSTTKLMPEGIKIALALPNVFAFRPCMFNDGVAADLTPLKVQGQLLMGFQWQTNRMDSAA
jgi:hypothetical protein